MLPTPAPFPYVGSYCLLEHEGETCLARIIMRREGGVVVSLPLRPDAGGNLTVDPEQLLDGTPLTPAETREFHELDRALAGRTRLTAREKVQKKRRDALRSRGMINAPLLARLLRQLDQARAAHPTSARRRYA